MSQNNFNDEIEILWAEWNKALEGKLNVDGSNVSSDFYSVIGVEYKIIYPTGMAEIYDPDNPYVVETDVFADNGFIKQDTRYVIENPFGINTPVITYLEVYYTSLSKWANPNFTTTTSNAGYGSISGANQGEGIIVQTGSNSMATNQGRVFGTLAAAWYDYAAPASNTVPCRIHVWKIGD